MLNYQNLIYSPFSSFENFVKTGTFNLEIDRLKTLLTLAESIIVKNPCAISSFQAPLFTFIRYEKKKFHVFGVHMENNKFNKIDTFFSSNRHHIDSPRFIKSFDFQKILIEKISKNILKGITQEQAKQALVLFTKSFSYKVAYLCREETDEKIIICALIIHKNKTRYLEKEIKLKPSAEECLDFFFVPPKTYLPFNNLLTENHLFNFSSKKRELTSPSFNWAVTYSYESKPVLVVKTAQDQLSKTYLKKLDSTILFLISKKYGSENHLLSPDNFVNSVFN